MRGEVGVEARSSCQKAGLPALSVGVRSGLLTRGVKRRLSQTLGAGVDVQLDT